jgi:hypothetical protein
MLCCVRKALNCPSNAFDPASSSPMYFSSNLQQKQFNSRELPFQRQIQKNLRWLFALIAISAAGANTSMMLVVCSAKKVGKASTCWIIHSTVWHNGTFTFFRSDFCKISLSFFKSEPRQARGCVGINLKVRHSPALVSVGSSSVIVIHSLSLVCS